MSDTKYEEPNRDATNPMPAVFHRCSQLDIIHSGNCVHRILNKIEQHMAWPESIDVALKEWASVVTALESGRQILMLRKGGILEQSGKNRFSITHNEFLFFPTYLHQSRGELKPEIAFEKVSSEPDSVRITLAGVVTDIFKIESRDQIDRLDDQHIWTPSLIDMRFNYKPRNPLYLVLVRAHRLAAPIVLANTPAFAGCKSWVPLEQAVEMKNATPVLDESTYSDHRNTVVNRLTE